MFPQWTHVAQITSLWRQNDVATSFWRHIHNDVIFASCAPWVSCTLLWTYMFAVISRINKWFVLYVTDLLYRSVLLLCNILTASHNSKNILLSHQMETFSALLGLCAGNSPITGVFPSQRPVTQSLDFFIWAWKNGWVNIRNAGDLRHHRAHYDVTVMNILQIYIMVLAHCCCLFPFCCHTYTVLKIAIS